MTFLGYKHSDWRNSEVKFTTPLNSRIVGRNKPDTYGGVIHANIALSVLKGVRINNTSWLTSVFVNFFIVLLFMFVLDILRIKKTEKLGLYGRLTAYTFVIIIIATSLLFYFKFNTRIDARLGIVYILALPEIYLVYINKFVPFIKRVRQRFKERRASTQ